MNSINNEYKHRINLALDFIEKNYAEELSLDKIASVANFSKFHFHRIFNSVMKETLFEFIQRIRLEKAATKLLQNTDTPVTDIAYDCGFSSPAVFARAFKDYFEMSASDWRANACAEDSNLSKMKSNSSKYESKFGKMISASTSYFCDVNNCSIIEWNCKMLNKEDLKVEVKELDAFDLAYVRHIGPYKGNSGLFERLWGEICGWAGPRGLIIPGKTKFISVYYDNPDITDEDKLRLDVCLSVPSDTVVNPPFGKMTMPKGKYAVCKMDIAMDEFQDAWNFVYGEWLPQSGFQPDDRPCYENYLSSPGEHTPGRVILEIVVPVKPM